MGQWENIFSKNGKVFLKKQEDMDSVISILKKNKVKKVLDLGCGTGRHTLLLAQHGFKVTATDISKTGISITKKCTKV